MSVFKSPLLLLGILVILITGGALIAPYYIDWGNYRVEFEKYGRQLTGRETTVAGDISVRLFPWPRMKIKDVRVANLPGAMLDEFFRADEIDIRLRLAPLLAGKLEVEAIEINRPVIGLERLANGQGSWVLQPQTGLSVVFGAEDVAVSGISITNGTIVLADGQRGGEAQLDGFNAFITARALNGPWKLRGEAVVNGQGISIALNTGKWRVDGPLKFGLRLAPVEGAGLTYSFDGQSSVGDKHEITGKLKIVPTASKKGKADAQADFRPVVFRADVKADFDQVKFSKIEVAPKDAVDVTTFVTGEAEIKFGSILRVDADLKAARFDMDSVLGNRGRKTLRSMGSLDAMAGFVERLPKNIHLHTTVALTTLIIAGESLDGVNIDLDVVETTLKINRLSVTLPGQTKAMFKGSLLAGLTQPQLIGDLKLDMISLKEFSKWLADSYKREIEQKWSGSRGRFKLAAKVDLSRRHFRLNDGRFSLDDAKGMLGLSVTTGEQPAIAMQIESDQLNVDRYASEGLLEEKSKADIPGFFIESLTKLVGVRDLSLVLKTGKLNMNGVEARDVALNFNANENTVEFRQFKLGRVGDAFVDLSGLVKFSDDIVTGSVDGTIKASDPTKLVKLIGVIEPSKDWITAVSPLRLKINGQAEARDKETVGKVRVSGTAGKSAISGNGRFTGTLSEWRKAQLHLSGQLSGESAKSLLAIFGVKTELGKDGAGKVALTATGKLDDGLATSADIEGFGVHSQFSGRITSTDAGPKAVGRLAVLIENTDQLFGILGVHPGDASPIGKVFSGEGLLDVTGLGFDLKEVRGTAAGTSFSGWFNLGFGDDQPVVKMNIKAGRLSLPFVLGTALLGRNGNRHSAATRFSPEALAGAKVDIKIKVGKLGLWPGFEVQKGKLLLLAENGVVKLTTGGERLGGKLVSLELDASVGTQITRMSGKISGTVLAVDLLQTNADTGSGTGVIAGSIAIESEFGGSGRTPGGLLAALSGKGIYEISNGVIKNISPTRFAEKLPQAETAKDVEAMIVSLLRTGDMKFGGGKGAIELENGVARFVSLTIAGPGAHGSLRAIYEIANGLADVSIRLKLDQPADVPGFEIAYAGPPDALAPSSNFTALKSHLTVAALNRTLDKLEALEEEQRRLVEEEKKARDEAQAKRKAQQEKQRLMREKQRRLLEEATKKKEQAKKPPVVPPVVSPSVPPPFQPPKEPQVIITPLPKPAVPAPAKIPAAPTTRLTVTPNTPIKEIPPLTTDTQPPLFIPLQQVPKNPTQRRGNWRSGEEIEGGR